MLPLKSIVKGTLNGALVFALIGIFVGAVVAMIVWPGSNLGPPVGMVYGFFWGAIIGGVLGFAYAMIRLSIRKPMCDSVKTWKTIRHLNESLLRTGTRPFSGGANVSFPGFQAFKPKSQVPVADVGR